MLSISRHHLLLVLSLLPSCLLAAHESAGSRSISRGVSSSSSSSYGLRALQNTTTDMVMVEEEGGEEDHDDHDHDGDGMPDHTDEEHNALMGEDNHDDHDDHEGEDDHHDHDHDDEVEFEWAGVFHLEDADPLCPPTIGPVTAIIRWQVRTS